MTRRVQLVQSTIRLLPLNEFRSFKQSLVDLFFFFFLVYRLRLRAVHARSVDERDFSVPPENGGSRVASNGSSAPQTLARYNRHLLLIYISIRVQLVRLACEHARGVG